jgi:dynein heavy chain
MVWIEPAELGWRPFVQTWMVSLHDGFTDDQKAILWKWFDEHVDQGIRFYRRQCKELIPTVDIQLVTSICKIFQSLTDSEKGGKGIDFGNVEDADKLLGLTYVFAYAWGLGGNGADDSKDKFDDFVHTEFENVIDLPPVGGVYELFVDVEQMGMTKWEKIVPEFKYVAGSSYFSMLVPTMDSKRFSYVMDACIAVDKSVMYTGESGVGKTCIAQQLFADLTPKGVVNVPLIFSAQTSSGQTQAMIEARLDKRRKTTFGPPPSKKMVRVIRRARKCFPVHRAGVNTVHLSSRCSSSTTSTCPRWRSTAPSRPSSCCGSSRTSRAFTTAASGGGRTSST